MTSRLLTSQGELDAAVDRMLALAGETIDIFDFDLGALSLDKTSRIDQLQRVLGERAHRLRIVVQDGSRLTARAPRLMRLFEMHGHHFILQQAPDSLSELRDTMMIVDGRHALVRFHRDQPRGKVIEDDATEVHPYAMRFSDIMNEGGHPLSPRVAGL
jgi:hypothetical protein